MDPSFDPEIGLTREEESPLFEPNNGAVKVLAVEAGKPGFSPFSFPGRVF